MNHKVTEDTKEKSNLLSQQIIGAALPVEYKGIKLDCGYRLDLIVDGLVIVELKSVERIEPVHEAQLLTYLRLKNLWLGLLINFNVPMLKSGIRRLVNG